MTLRTRLLVFFLGMTAALLVGFSAALYALAGTYLHRQAEERLESAVNTLIAAAEVNDEGVEWEPSERRLAFNRGIGEGQLLWVVCDEAGRRIDGSPAGTDDLFGPLIDGAVPLGRARDAADARGAPWRLLARRLEGPRGRADPRPVEARNPQFHPSLILGAGIAMAGVREVLNSLALMLAGLSAGTWLLALFVGGRICGRALRPVSSMSEAAHAIGADDPARRLPETRSGDELEELGRAFNGLLDRLHEAHERQGRFTGEASHQLRTPLTAMQGQVDLALRQARTVEEYQRVLGLVQRKARHLRRIVEALLFLARADAEALAPDLDAIDLDAWLPAHLEARAEGPRADDVRLEVGAGGPHRVRAQASLLGELVDNLLDNAAKYGEPGTPILVRLGRSEGTVRLAVSDRGPGIVGDDLPHLFEPFFRSDDARRRGVAGTGLGLSVASRLARLFGGAIGVESRPGRGSTFTLGLPDAGTDPAGPGDASLAAPPAIRTAPPFRTGPVPS